MLFYRWLISYWWSRISNQFDGIGDIFTIDRSNDTNNDIIAKNDNTDKSTWSNKSNNEKRWIINEDQVRQIKDRNNVIINPIADWYYEIIARDTSSLPSFIETTKYIIPEPISTKSCDINYSYWNLRPEHLNYNWFIYEYINSHKDKDVLIALLDSWIDWNNKTLKWHTAVNLNEVNDGKDSDQDWYVDDIAWVNIVSWNWNTQDSNGHWTHVAWIILQTFPNASILPIKLTDWDTEYIDEYSIIKWLRYAIDANVDVISMSFWWEWSNEVTKTLIKEATDKWIVVIAAAWNEWEDVSWYYPASYTGVINVGSVGQNWISSFSNTNTDTLLPWECIRSYWFNEQKVFWWWTSMAAPHLAWVLWTYLSIWKTLWNESEILSIINKNSKTVNKNKILDASKLFWLEKDNNNAYKYIWSIESTLETIQSKLNKLQNSKFTEQDVTSIASYKSTLAANATNLSNLYNKLWINNWFGIELKKDIDEYNNFLNQLNIWWLYLETDWGTLKNSLWVRSCYSDYDTVCDTFSVIITKWVSLPANGTENYSTMEDWQTAIEFEIFQWENSKASLNKKLWSVTISGLPSKSKWEAWAKVYFSVDSNWKLQATATDVDNVNNSRKVTINSVARNTVIITWDNYYKVKSAIDELIVKTDNLKKKIKNFNSLNPFDYIPESLSWSYIISKKEFIIPEFQEKEEIKNNEVSTWSKSDILENIKVEEVIDWDTIRVTLNGQSQKIRLIWVDAPESYDTRYGYTECFWTESSKYLKKLLSNKTIWLEYDSTQWRYDKYDRVLAYVFLNWENINEKIIADWYGWEYTYNLPYKYQKEFKEAQSNASKSNKWLWNENTCNWEKKAWN